MRVCRLVFPCLSILEMMICSPPGIATGVASFSKRSLTMQRQGSHWFHIGFTGIIQRDPAWSMARMRRCRTASHLSVMWRRKLHRFKQLDRLRGTSQTYDLESGVLGCSFTRFFCSPDSEAMGVLTSWGSYFKYKKSCMFAFWSLVARAAACRCKMPLLECCLRFGAAGRRCPWIPFAIWGLCWRYFVWVCRCLGFDPSPFQYWDVFRGNAYGGW